MQITPGKKFWVIAATLMLLGLVVAALVVILNSRSAAVAVPDAVQKQTQFPIYVPEQLPPGYHTVEDSFRADEGVLVFSISDDAGRTIAVTEQRLPEGLDFESFYKEQMKDVRQVSGAPYASMIGQASVNGRPNGRLLSIKTDTTWVMVSSQTSSDSDLEIIARQLRKFDK